MTVKTFINPINDDQRITIQQLHQIEGEPPILLVDFDTVYTLKRALCYKSVLALNIVDVTVGERYNDIIITTK